MRARFAASVAVAFAPVVAMGQCSTLALHPLGGIAPRHLATGAIRQPGIADVLVTDLGAGDLKLLLNDGAGRFASPIVLDVTGSPNGVAIADLGGDGTLDILVATQSPASLQILRGLGGGSFAPPEVHSGVGGNQPFAVEVGDLNGDPYPDVVVAGITTSSSVTIMYGTAGGTLSLPLSLGAGGRWDLLITDVDRDGHNDVLASRYNGSSITVFPGGGNGIWRTPVEVSVRDPRGMALADLNGDGYQDMIVASYAGDEVATLLARPQGWFESAAYVPVHDNPAFVDPADFDGDSRADVLVTSWNSTACLVLEADTTGSLQPLRTIDIGANPFQAIAVDIDRDEIADVIATDQINAFLRIVTSREPRPEILSHPNRVHVRPGDEATFQIQTIPSAELDYRWMLNGVGIENGPRVSGADTPAVTIMGASDSDVGLYRCEVRNGTCANLSEPATLNLLPECAADVNLDGAVDSDDVIDFFAQWDIGC